MSATTSYLLIDTNGVCVSRDTVTAFAVGCNCLTANQHLTFKPNTTIETVIDTLKSNGYTSYVSAKNDSIRSLPVKLQFRGPLKIDKEKFTFYNCDSLYFDEAASIVLENWTKLNLNGSILTSCDTSMWQGIKAIISH